MKKNFQIPLAEEALNLNEKNRSNIFTWRGQFTPQLIENLIDSYCSSEDVILDPFCGSGTVLYEASKFNHKTYGVELNPSAFILSKTYELITLSNNNREKLLNRFKKKFDTIFHETKTYILGEQQMSSEYFQSKIAQLAEQLDDKETILLNTFVILMDLNKKKLNYYTIENCINTLLTIVKDFHFSQKPISTILGDARKLPLESNIIDFVITSPPYINVFNYHQNYRKSAELLGWDLLKIAKSEIGSNRANRGNRFLTVVQYSIDLANVLKELHRVCKPNSKLILIIGHESRVLGVPFFNADIIQNICASSGQFKNVLCQKRIFKNKFGKMIREDLIHLVNTELEVPDDELLSVSRKVAEMALNKGLKHVENKNRESLIAAIQSACNLNGTHTLDINNYSDINEILIKNDKMTA